MKHILERTHGDEAEIKVLNASKVITGTGSEPIKDGVIVVEGNTIKEVGPKSRVKPPAGAYELDLGKVTLMPGMIDAHAHILGVRSYSSAETITTPHDLLVLRAAEDCLKLLKAGFTTVRAVEAA